MSCGKCHNKVRRIRLRGVEVQVDECLAPLLVMLDIWGIETISSCCGHGEKSPTVKIKSGEFWTIEIISRPRVQFPRWANSILYWGLVLLRSLYRRKDHADL